MQEDASGGSHGAIGIWRVEESSSEFLMYEFYQIADATNKFSNGNKLGEGGFGRVYKVNYFVCLFKSHKLKELNLVVTSENLKSNNIYILLYIHYCPKLDPNMLFTS
jgi:hypothetical protein